jgi:hypothetical protein
MRAVQKKFTQALPIQGTVRGAALVELVGDTPDALAVATGNRGVTVGKTEV